MNVKLVRTLLIAVLMIASSQVAMMEGYSDTELKEETRRSEVVMAPSNQDPNSASCLGNDACTGSDAGVTSADIIDITPAVTFDPDPSSPITSITGSLDTWTSSGAISNDIYKLSVPWGFGIQVDIITEDTPGGGHSTQQNAYYGGIYTCDTFDLGLSGGISTFSSDCGVDSVYPMYVYTPVYQYLPVTSPAEMSTNGTDVGGKDIWIQVYCYDCGPIWSSPTIDEYTLEITAAASDGGTGQDFGFRPLSSATYYDKSTVYTCNHPDADPDACAALPNLVDDFEQTITGFVSGHDEPPNPYAYDSYTVDIPDDMDLAIKLTIDCYTDMCGYMSGVGYIPGRAHLILDGSQNYYFYNSGTVYNTVVGYGNDGNYIWDAPAFGWNTPYHNVKEWSVSGNDADTIDIGLRMGYYTAMAQAGVDNDGFSYKIELEYKLAATAPCATSDDGGSGDDASDEGFYEDGDHPVPISITGSQIRGTICQDYDNNDFYSMTVPSGYGVSAVLDWGDTTTDNSTATYDGLDFELFVDDSTAYDSISDATKDDANPQVVNSNTSLLFMPAGGNLVVDSTELESFGSTDDITTVTLAAGDELNIELETRAWGGEVYVYVEDPSGTTQTWNAGTFGNNNYYTANWPTYTDVGTYTVTVGDTFGDGCTCTLFVLHSYVPADVPLPDNNVVFQVSVDNLPADEVVNYTITYDIFEVTTHQFMPVPDAHYGADTTASDPGVLYSANYTYTGYMHDWWDKSDFFEIYLPEDYGMSIVVHSHDWNDIDIVTSFGNDGDGVDPAGPASKTYNGANGGSTETIQLKMEVGAGMYDLVVQMWTTALGPSSDDDAGTGGDAADHYMEFGNSRWNVGGNPLNDGRAGNGEVTWLNDSFLDATTGMPIDGTVTGTINHMWDRTDAYWLAIPNGYYMNLTVASLSGDGSQVSVLVFENTDYSSPLGLTSNDQIMAQGWLTYGNATGSSSQPHQGHYVAFNIWSYQLNSDTSYDYSISIEWDDIANKDCGLDDDAGTCTDAPDTYSNCLTGGTWLPCNNGIILDSTVDVDHTFTGWGHSSDDYYDQYQIDVPADYGLEVNLDLVGSAGNYAHYQRGATTFNQIDYAFGSTSASIYPTTTTTNDSSTLWTGGENVILVVRSGSYHGTDEKYEITYNLFSLDSDGDTWYDSVEIDCTTANTTGAVYNTSDPLSFPPDNDKDGLCDELDSDDDNDGVDDSVDAFPFDDSESSDLDGDGIGDNADDDLDGDGWLDADELNCLTDANDANSVPIDSDYDTICDVMDDDKDGDGVVDELDYYFMDAGASVNTDGDAYPDDIHPGWLQNASAYAYDPANSVFETTLMADDDDDNDGFTDSHESDCQTDPLVSTSIPIDSDGDGICDVNDNDTDGDGVDNAVDAFPTSPCASIDTDGDGLPDSLLENCVTSLNDDLDDDNDGYLDSVDAFSLDPAEWADTDEDGIGDNADLNDDDDAWTDSEEFACGSDPLDSASVPADFDADGVCDKVDTDDDGDGSDDELDAFPFDANENSDNDLDGIGDYADTDDDNDGWLDSEEPNCGTDPYDYLSVPLDMDVDHLCDDVQDSDDDNDGRLDIDDVFPTNPREQDDNDGDGIGDNEDSDDDNDEWSDEVEALCAANGGSGDSRSASITPADLDGDGICDAVDPDDDGDGYPDPVNPNDPQEFEDFFPRDATEWHDNNGDGVGDVGTPLTLMDDIEADPAPFAGVSIVVLAGIALIARSSRGGVEEDDDLDMYDETDEFLDEEYDEEEVEA